MPRPSSRTFTVNEVVSYGEHHRSPGDIVSDIPEESIEWLLARGAITEGRGQTIPEPAAPEQKDDA